MQKRTVAVLTEAQLALLKQHGLCVKNEAKIDSYIKQGKEAQAIAYFQKVKNDREG